MRIYPSRLLALLVLEYWYHTLPNSCISFKFAVESNLKLSLLTIIQTSCLCLLAGADVDLPEGGSEAKDKDEWIVVLGGSGVVGQFAVQVESVRNIYYFVSTDICF